MKKRRERRDGKAKNRKHFQQTFERRGAYELITTKTTITKPTRKRKETRKQKRESEEDGGRKSAEEASFPPQAVVASTLCTGEAARGLKLGSGLWFELFRGGKGQ